MKNEGHDKLVKDKIDALDTLSSGFVFGRDEAWEKLQARLEAKPARKIKLEYRLAAAASLLLAIGVVALYQQPKKLIATNAPVKMKEEMKSAPLVIQPPPVSAKQTPVIRLHTARKEKRKNNTAASPDSTTDLQQMQAIFSQIDKRDKDIAKITAGSIPPQARKPMKVVHINELNDNEEPAPLPAVANNTPQIDLKKLPVVHINDVMQEEYDMQQMMRGSRLGIGRLFNHGQDSNIMEYNTHKSFYKSIFQPNEQNTQISNGDLSGLYTY